MNTSVNHYTEAFRRWWAYDILGVLFILMALFVITHPVISYAGLVLYFAVAFVVSGILRIVTSYANREVMQYWGWYSAGGVLDILIGALLLMRLDVAAVALSVYVGVFILFGSMAAIFRAFEMKTTGFRGWGWPLFTAIAGILFSFLILTNLIFGASTIVLWTAMGFLSMGGFYIYLGIHLRRINKGMEHFGEGLRV